MCPYFLITTLSYGTKDSYSKRPFCFPLALCSCTTEPICEHKLHGSRHNNIINLHRKFKSFGLLSNSNLQLKGLLNSVDRKLAQTNYFFLFFLRTDFRLREYPPSHMSSTLGTNSQTPSISWKP